MRILLRTSRWASWSRKLAGLAVPLVVIPVVMHRQDMLDDAGFLVSVGLGGAVAALALVLGLVALVQLWRSGDQGWNRAITGIFLALLCLLPFGYWGALAYRHGAVSDIATTDRTLLPLVFDPGMPAPPAPTLLPAAAQAARYPNAQTRTYPLLPEQVFPTVQQLVADQRWTVRLERPPSGEVPGQINAQITTLLGWREEVVIRVAPGGEGTNVDMRSASLEFAQDFGGNGARVEAFLVELDAAVTTLLRDSVVVAPVEPEEEAAATP